MVGRSQTRGWCNEATLSEVYPGVVDVVVGQLLPPQAGARGTVCHYNFSKNLGSLCTNSANCIVNALVEPTAGSLDRNAVYNPLSLVGNGSKKIRFDDENLYYVIR